MMEEETLIKMVEQREPLSALHAGPVSFLWQREGYYRTLPFIMKGLELTGWRGWRGEGGALTAGKQEEEEEEMNE